MRKLTWLGSILLTLVVCSTSISQAQNVRYEYAGPLDGRRTVPLSDVVSSGPAHRVARLKPAEKVSSSHPAVSPAILSRITGVSALPPSTQAAGRITGRAFSAPRSNQVIREALPLEVPPPTFAGPLTESTGFPAEASQIQRQNNPTQFGYSGALTDPRTPPVATSYVPRQDASAQFGSSRALTNPRNRPADAIYLPRQDTSAQFGSSRVPTRPRTPPAATSYIPSQNDSAQFGSLQAPTSSRTPPAATSYIPPQNDSAQFSYSETPANHANHPVEADYIPTQNESAQFGYAGALTDPGGYQTEAGYIPAMEDPTRFGYRDGKAFGFENNRLYNPLEGPRLDLQGAPTVDFGEEGCDEWANFSRIRDLEYDTACGGLKAKPGHLGIPWLGNKDACDQTVPLLKNRSSRRRHSRPAAEEVCETCGSCPTCGR